MPNFPRIAVINTGWSDDYRGAAVRGNFGYLAKGVADSNRCKANWTSPPCRSLS